MKDSHDPSHQEGPTAAPSMSAGFRGAPAVPAESIACRTARQCTQRNAVVDEVEHDVARRIDEGMILPTPR